jgi:hypothetical protein
MGENGKLSSDETDLFVTIRISASRYSNAILNKSLLVLLGLHHRFVSQDILLPIHTVKIIFLSLPQP